MKRVLKIIGYLLALFVIVITGILSYIKLALPSVDPAENISIEYTQERIEHGRYLANHVSVCM
jgi:hypothetical protein